MRRRRALELWALLLAVVAFGITQAFKLRPTYRDHRQDRVATYNALRRIADYLPVMLSICGVGAGPAFAFDPLGVQLFEENCVSCHVGGGNIIGYARGKTLKSEALKKNGVDTKDSIVTLLRDGKGVMPRYSAYTRKNGDEVPAKLTDDEMAVVADYVLEQAKAGWQ